MKNNKRYICLLLCLAIAASCCAFFTAPATSAEAVAGENLIKNPSFEWDGNWATGSIFRTTDKAHSGSYSLKTNVRGVNVVVCTANTVAVKPGTDYLFSGYIYRNDNSAWAYIDMNDLTGELQLLDLSTTDSWQYVSGIWNSGNCTSVTPRLVVEPNYTINQHMGAGVTGDIWFDDISLCELSYGSYSEESADLSANAKYYTLKNRDISVTVAGDKNSEYITMLSNNCTNTQWISSPRQMSLTSTCKGKNLNLTLQSATFDNTASLNNTGADACHSLCFTYSTSVSGLTLKSVYSIYDTGPLYHYCEIINNSKSTVEFDSSELIPMDIILESPSAATVYRFNRSRYNNGFDGNFTKGVLTDTAKKDMLLKTVVENSRLSNSGLLPFEVLHCNNEGLYTGYEWSYGEITLRTQQNPCTLRLSATLGSGDDTAIATQGETLLVPPVFIGAYEGSVDDGCNQMKGWFYDHLMTETLRENANEPNIELHLPLFAESDLKGYLQDCDLEDWGVELTKMDYWWTVPGSDFDATLEQLWNPDKNKWPSGMTYGKLVKESYPTVKTSLYMADTFEGVDIGTEYGRNKQLDALKTRLSNWQIDYWRSDFDLLIPNNYENHEGLMYILDELIAYDEDFRYEHCSAGGSLKDFATLRRMTFMTMEDSGGALNHRMAFYSNSYMINPVQLKFDLGFDWTSNEDSSYINSNKNQWYTYNVRTAMMGAMMVQNVSNRLNSDELAALKNAWSLYKDKQRPILKGADVYHILPMPTGKTIDGMEFYNHDLEKGSVFIFRDKQGETSVNLKLQGLDENATYRLEFEDRTHLNCEKSGRELMQTGINVSGLTKTYDSEIIWIENLTPNTETQPATETTVIDSTEATGTDETEATSATDTPDAPDNTSPAFTDPSETTTPSEGTTSVVPVIPPVILPTTETQPTSDTHQSTTTLPDTAKALLGDSDLSGNVNIKDATLIQKFLAQLESLDGLSLLTADTDLSESINIKDATLIQKYLANYELTFPIGKAIS